MKQDLTTMFTGMSNEKFMQIPYHYWAVEFVEMIKIALPKMFYIWFTQPFDTAKNIIPYLIAVLIVLLFSTIFIPIAPYVVKYIAKEDNDQNGFFFLNSTYVANRMITFAAIVGTDVEQFDLNNEKDKNTLHWMMIGKR